MSNNMCYVCKLKMNSWRGEPLICQWSHTGSESKHTLHSHCLCSCVPFPLALSLLSVCLVVSSLESFLSACLLAPLTTIARKYLGHTSHQSSIQRLSHSHSPMQSSESSKCYKWTAVTECPVDVFVLLKHSRAGESDKKKSLVIANGNAN